MLSDRSQTPSGFGYALENRTVISRVFPSLYRSCEVHRLAPFFRSLRMALQAASPPFIDDPRIVVLTPGPRSHSAFEHAFLASQLGYSLVEGSDLCVRGGRVWLRSLGRLQPVHVILRRLDAGFCDPLELMADSQLGVAGLVEACRVGNVTVVNALGSSVIENPGLLPYLPGVARHLLGGDLQLPAVETWWCGDPVGRSHVLARLDELVIKPIGREDGAEAAFGWTLNGDEREALRRRIEANPVGWVGQVAAAMSSTPTLGDAGLEPRRTVLRAFAVARNQSYTVMPGGLATVASGAEASGDRPEVSISKDIWVLASEPERMTGFWLQTGPAVKPGDPGSSIPSRVAENLFWLGRYAERAEGVARLLRVVYDRRNDFPGNANPAGTSCLSVLLGRLDGGHHDLARLRRQRRGGPAGAAGCRALPTGRRLAPGRARWPTPSITSSTPPTACATSCPMTPGWPSGRSTVRSSTFVALSTNPKPTCRACSSASFRACWPCRG